jgi:hypothetical protein
MPTDPPILKSLLISRSKDLTLKGTLEMFINPAHNLEIKWQQAAQGLWDLFEAENWGEPVQQASQTQSSSHGDPPSNSRNSSGQGAQPCTAIINGAYRKAPPAHPIFGLQGCMHHIAICKASTTSYKIYDGFNKTTFKVFGNNGIAVGTCWANQIAALRDGAHGKYQYPTRNSLLTVCRS